MNTESIIHFLLFVLVMLVFLRLLVSVLGKGIVVGLFLFCVFFGLLHPAVRNKTLNIIAPWIAPLATLLLIFWILKLIINKIR